MVPVNFVAADALMVWVIGVATDALLLEHQAISIQNTEKINTYCFRAVSQKLLLSNISYPG